MKPIPTLSVALLLALSAAAQTNTTPPVPFEVTSGTPRVNLTLSDWTLPYKFLKTCPASPGLVGVPSFYFKASSDGTNFQVISPNQSIGYSNATAGAQCYAPATVYANGYYWTMYDVFAVVGPSNIFALDKSSDLMNWTSVGLFTNATVNDRIWGSEWFTDTDGTIRLVLGSYNGQSGIWLTAPQNTSMSAFATATQLTTRKLYDPALFYHSGKYYLWGSSNGVVQLLTNSTVSGTYSLHTYNVLSNLTSLSLEGAQVISLGTSNYLMYVQTDPSGLVKTYYARSTNLVDWTGFHPVQENGTISGHGSVLRLPQTPAVKAQQTHLTHFGRDRYELVYSLTTASGAGSASTPVIQVAAGSSALFTASILGASEDGQTASFELTRLGQADGSPGFSEIGTIRTNKMWIPAASYGATFGTAGGGPYVTVTGPTTTTTHWKVRITQEQVSCTNGIAIDPTVVSESPNWRIISSARPTGLLSTNGTHRAVFTTSVVCDDGFAAEAEIHVFPQNNASTNVWGRGGIGASTSAGGLFSSSLTAYLNPGDVWFVKNINASGGLTVVSNTWHLVEF